MSTPFRLHIPCRLYNAMLDHAVAELPNECCGLLAGRLPVRGGTACLAGPEGASPVIEVIRQYPLINAAASAVEFLSDARSMFNAVRDMRRLDLEIVAIYHSHPTSDPIPSRTDLARNYSAEVMNLIISLKTGTATARAWWLTAESFHEAEWEVLEEG